MTPPRRPTLPPSGFVALRDPHTLKVVCHYNPATREVLVIQRGDMRRATLPPPPSTRDRPK